MTPSRSAKMIASGASSTMRWQSHSRSYVTIPHDLPARKYLRVGNARCPDRTLLYPHLAFSAASKESDMRRLLAVAPAEVDPPHRITCRQGVPQWDPARRGAG